MDQGLTNEYIARINRAIDHIEANLQNQFTLEELAAVANFSKFHFHRIFKGILGETPFQFILRIRLEKGAFLIAGNHEKSLTEIAFQCGFSDLSIFSRNFKAFFGTSPTKYREESLHKSKISQTLSKLQQKDKASTMYVSSHSTYIKWKSNMKMNKGVEVMKLPEMTVAYIRHIGPYKGDEKLFEKLWNRLFRWAGPRGLIGGPGFMSLIVYHDDPNVTVEDKLRMSVCISVPAETDVRGEVGKMKVEGGKYARARFQVTANEFEHAWNWVFGEWLPASGYQPDDKPCFEMYPEEPKDGLFTVDICVPVKPL